MPDIPLSPCRICGALRCEAHQRKAWTHRAPVERIRGRKLQAIRARLFAQQPECVVCLKAGRHRLAVIRDHIIPLMEGGADDEVNQQGLCQDCSDAKTAIESARSRRG